MTGARVKEEVSKYWKSLPPEVQALKPARAGRKKSALKPFAGVLQPHDLVQQLQETTAGLSNAMEIRELLEEVTRLISEGSVIHVDSDSPAGESLETPEPTVAA